MSKGSNVYKFHSITLQEDEARVIDVNELMAAKIAALSQDLEAAAEDYQEDFDGDFTEEFSEGLDPEQVSALLEEDASGNVIKAEPVYDGPSPEELIASAQAEIDQMMQQAMEEANHIKNSAYEEGAANGYNDGVSKGREETEMLKDELRREYADKEQQLMALYQQKIDEIEPGLVEILTDVYEHVFNVSLAENRNILMHLIENALQKTEGSSEYIIRVSSEDMPFVSMQKNELMEAGGITSGTLNVIEDVTLKKNQCLIETENGIFDCSLGVELQELKKQLVLLAYHGVE